MYVAKRDEPSEPGAVLRPEKEEAYGSKTKNVGYESDI